MTADRATHGDRPPSVPLRVDVFLLAGQFPGTSHAQALRNAVSDALAAERAGFDGVWIAQHHFISYGVCPSALTLAAHLLGRTERIRVGTAACILSNGTRSPSPRRRCCWTSCPAAGSILAWRAAAPGSTWTCSIPGWTATSTASGCLDLLLAWLSGADKVAADGPRFRFPPVAVVPTPRRPVPVRIAATSPSTVALVAARGLPLLPGMHGTDEEKHHLLGQFRGHGPAGLPHASTRVA